MTATPRGMRQVMDWSAAFWAGLVAGTVFLFLNLWVVPPIPAANPWVFLRLVASIGLGDGVLAPPATFDGRVLAVALAIHYALSLAFAFVSAIMLHRWGFFVGLIGGAVFGAMLYAINVYSLTLAFPWFFGVRGLAFFSTHVIFGAVSGAIYELLEKEEFVPVTPEVAS
ncbi:MAG: hypothetical protein R3B81_13840 [bacterium]